MPADASFKTTPQPSGGNQAPTTATNGTVSDLPKFSPNSSRSPPAPTTNNSKVALETVFASSSASALSTPTYSLVNVAFSHRRGSLVLDLGVVYSTSDYTPVHISIVIYRPLTRVLRNYISHLPYCGATDSLSAAHNVTAPADSHARCDLSATWYATRSHEQRQST